MSRRKFKYTKEELRKLSEHKTNRKTVRKDRSKFDREMYKRNTRRKINE